MSCVRGDTHSGVTKPCFMFVRFACSRRCRASRASATTVISGRTHNTRTLGALLTSLRTLCVPLLSLGPSVSSRSRFLEQISTPFCHTYIAVIRQTRQQQPTSGYVLLLGTLREKAHTVTQQAGALTMPWMDVSALVQERAQSPSSGSPHPPCVKTYHRARPT